MSRIGRTLLVAALLGALALTALSGCGDTNSRASLNPVTGAHPANWLPLGHRLTATKDIRPCQDCHGTDLNGGIVKVSCTGCHLGNATSVHPLLWGNFAYAFHAGYVETNGNASCANALCHGTALTGVLGSGPSCGVNCHMAGTPQAPQHHSWVSTDRATNVAGHIAYFQVNGPHYTTCRNNACHGGAGSSAPPPGVFLSGPGCLTCHGAGNPLPAEAP